MPNTLIEAQAAGVPIISSNCPTGPKEIIGNNKFGYLFKVGDHMHLTKKIMKYSKNKRKIKKMILNGFTSLKKYDFETNCKAYYNCIKKYLLY